MKDFSEKYLNLLSGEFSTINLTRIEDPESFYYKQILDSVLPLEKSKYFLSDLQSRGVMVDIGFGGGFPILPLAKKLPEVKFFGFEARAKKASVVTKIADRLEVRNVKLMHMMLESVFFDQEVVITFKAVGKIDEYLSMINTSKKLRVYFYKGPNYSELENLEKVKASWSLIEEINYDLPGTEGRSLLCFENKIVPRGTEKNKIKFSSLL